MKSSFLNFSKMLQRGGVLLYPTDTIYALGCDAFLESSVQKIYEMKQRKSHTPFLLLASSVEQIQAHFKTEEVFLTLKKLWPGPYTILLEPQNPQKFSKFILNKKVALRVPNTKWLSNLFLHWKGFLVSTSANISDKVYQSNWVTLKNTFSDKVDLMIQESELSINQIPSAILNWNQEWEILREGFESKKKLFQKLKVL